MNFKIKKHWVMLFLLGLQELSAGVDRLQTSIDDVTQKMRVSLSQNASREAVIVVGPSGSGKSTLINYLGERPLTAVDSPKGRILEINGEPLPGFVIGNGNTAGTLSPCTWYDQVNRISYWDCPGSGDSRGVDQDIVNAFAIQQLFINSPVKVLLVISQSDLIDNRASNFLRTLRTLSNALRNTPHLKDSLALGITKQRDTDAGWILNSLLNSPPADLQIEDDVRGLIEVLAVNAQNRVAFLPYPQNVGDYSAAYRDQIITKIQGVPYINSQNIGIALQPSANQLVEDLTRGLNNVVCERIRGEINQRIVENCLQYIREYRGGISKLREYFQGIKRILSELSSLSSENPQLFTEQLQPIVNVTNIVEKINQISFLKRIVPTVTHNVGEWYTALTDSLNQLTSLQGALGAPVVRDGVLELKGIILGTSDINSAIRSASNNSDMREVRIYGLNTLFFDEDITQPGISLSFIAPRWVMPNAMTINISGRNGDNGSNGTPISYGPGGNGQPGKHGWHSGHFYGKIRTSEALSNLKIIANGGNGGNGGNGANGAAGVNGTPGNPKLCENNKGNPCGTNNTSNCMKVANSHGGQDTSHRALGTPGTNGQNGGNAGNAGSGGNPGVVSVNGCVGTVSVQPGTPGTHGDPGQGGAAAVNGQSYRGHWQTDGLREWRYDPGFFHKTKTRQAWDVSQWKSMMTAEPITGTNAGNPGSAVQGKVPNSRDAIVPLNEATLNAAYEAYRQEIQQSIMRPFIENING